MFSSNQTSAKTSTNVIKHHGVTSKSKRAGTSEKLKLTITPSGISLAILKDLSPGCSARKISYYSLLTTYYLLLTLFLKLLIELFLKLLMWVRCCSQACALMGRNLDSSIWSFRG